MKRCNDSMKGAVQCSQNFLKDKHCLCKQQKTRLRNIALKALIEAKKTIAETSELTEPQIQVNVKFTAA